MGGFSTEKNIISDRFSTKGHIERISASQGNLILVFRKRDINLTDMNESFVNE